MTSTEMETETWHVVVAECQLEACSAPFAEPRLVELNKRGRQIGGRIYCGPECKDAASQVRHRRIKLSRQARFAIAYRDGYVCHICRDLVDVSLPPSDPQSFTLDHIVALENGGPDTEANLATAHHGCNAAKGARG